jgi:phospholipid/cholesterol/gamma-HCH transport system substrate-binding protein
MNNKNFAVGLFVSAALAMFFIATIWLTGKQGSEPTVDYSMYFESDVGGLMLGGPVFFLGVKVGTVKAMTIIPGDPNTIRVEARLLEEAPIDSGTYASLAMQGVTGVAVIKLNADSGENRPLTRQDGEGNLVIATRDSGFSALLQKAPEIVEKLDDALININEILGQKNQENIAQILADISALTGTLASKQESIGAIPESANSALMEFEQVMQEARAILAEVRPGLGNSMENITKATEDLASLSNNLDSWIEAYSDDVSVFMEDGLGQVPPVIDEARTTLREFKRLIKELRNNPSLLIYKPNEDSIDVEK